jgi:inorganic pyrophosphatase
MVASPAVSFAMLRGLPPQQWVRIEVPRGSFVKRTPRGALDFVSPLPCPYNYGSVVGPDGSLDTAARGSDGDPLDALVLGPRLAAGRLVATTVRAVFGFCDAGVEDPKLVCSDAPLSAAERAGVERFFALYAWLKRAVHRVRGEAGPTRALGWLAYEPPA